MQEDLTVVISGTNRPNSRTSLVAEYCFDELKKITPDIHYIDLVDLVEDFVHPDMYDADQMRERIKKLQDEVLIPAKRIVLVCPEYNGSYAGIVKLFVDALSVRKFKTTFGGKQMALIGVATGRAGNIRGLEDLTGFFHYLGVHIYPNKLPLSKVGDYIEGGKLIRENLPEVKSLIQKFMEN